MTNPTRENSSTPHHNKQLLVAVVLAAFIAVVFWSQSRVPALNEKAQMGLRTNFSDIAFEILLPVTAEQNIVVRVLRSAVNWAYTNLYGMSFGLLFAAAVLTILANLRRRQFRSAWLNSLSGVAIGAPLGVCVNCATPIAFGLYSAGARLETALASMIASPTLNAIVLTMAFTLLPFEIAMAKLAGVVFLLVSIPFLVRRFSKGVDIHAVSAVSAVNAPRLPPLDPPPVPADNQSMLMAVAATARQFVKNLWYLVRYAVPFMLLAGLLGAVAIELVPFESFANSGASAISLVVAAFVAVILPVPIAFDVIVSKALLEGGVNTGLVTAFLFGLGTYSIYPAFMIARYISIRLSLAVGLTVVFIAVALGYSANVFFANKHQAQRVAIEAGLAEATAALYRQSIDVCDSLPAHLKTSCFTQHIEQFDALVPRQTMCRTRPDSFDSVQCNAILEAHDVTQQAYETADANGCVQLDNEAARARCVFRATLRTAQQSHDIGLCGQLQQHEMIVACRENYLNASLLFNPDDSACAGLPTDEQRICKVNAAVYRYADALDFDGCDTLIDASARDHCRYTVASTTIGRHNDSSGCERIQSQAMAARCRSLTTAWTATREQRFDICGQLPDTDLQNTCLLKVADLKIQSIYAEVLLTTTQAATSTETGPGTPVPGDTGEQEAPNIEWRTLPTQAGVSVAFAPFFVAPQTATLAFRQLTAAELGITHYWNFRASDFFEPFIVGKGIASGDINGDTWPDLVLATERGIQLYRNTGGNFERVAVEQGELGNANLFLVAIVDADNDGRQDVFASAYGGTNFLLYNEDGHFSRTRLQTFKGPQRLTFAAGFGDLNEDGQLDIVLGNWSSGVEKFFVPEQSENFLWLRDRDGYDMRALDEMLGEITGETISVLLADINGDSHTDLLVGNDRLVPDFYYLGNGDASFKPVSRTSGMIPMTSMFTMSLDAADIDNDLDTDLFASDMTFARSSRKDYCGEINDGQASAHCVSQLEAYAVFQSGSATRCSELEGSNEIQSCFVAFAIKAAKDLKDPKYCDKLPQATLALRSLCQYLATPAPAEAPIDLQEHLQQTQQNTLLINTGSAFVEQARSFGVSSSFWSWNAKAADLDNDSWQDIYVGNGFHFGDDFYEIQENILFRNIAGQHFEPVQQSWGLNDPINTPSYTYADIDLDGDIDIVATGVLAPPRIFVNELNTGNSVTIVLNDTIGHTQGIGSDITIRYGGSAKLAQRKESILSGGFLSFNNPVLHFGLGEHETIDEIIVRWPDGDETKLSGPFPANRIYRFGRQ